MPRLSEPDTEAWEGYDRPPPAEQRLVELYTRWRERRRSAHIPLQPLEAARWWVAHQEPPNDYVEAPERTYNKRGEFSGWRTPYHDRIFNNFQIFLGLPEAAKAFVVEHVEAGIPWRGDSIPLYKWIIEETRSMLKDPEAYRRLGEQIRRGAVNAKP